MDSPYRIGRWRHCLLLLALAGLVGLTPARAEKPALGFIVGYKAAVDELRRDETDRGPWADRREREHAAWQRAAKRSRERTQALGRSLGLPMAGVGEAGRAALIRLQRPMQGPELEDAMRRLRLHPDVEWVEPNVLEGRLAIPNDTRWADQWHLREPGLTMGNFQPAALNMPAAWDISTGATGAVRVAVVDTGVRFSHPDLAGRLLGGHDFVSELAVANDGNGRDNDPSDPGDWVDAGDLANPLFGACDLGDSSWHGTFIAGQIAALSNNGSGVAGLNWDARVVPVRVAGKCGALVSDLLDGARWAAGLPVAGVPSNPYPARVVNLSFGGSTACTAAYQSMVDDLRAAGALLVVAAGNQATALQRPADCSGVMAVASVRRDGAKADYSSFGPNVALSAPGGSCNLPDCDDRFTYTLANGGGSLLLSTDNAGTQGPGADTYGYKQGTSFSAPQAAGVASLMLTLNPSLTPTALIERMQLGARAHTAYTGVACSAFNNTTCDCTTSTCGAGLLDAERALQLATGPAAVIAPVGGVLPGAQITLDGRGSLAQVGRSIQSYRWTLESGPTGLSIPNDTQALTGLQLPASVEGRWVFRLTVQDDLGAQGSDLVLATAARPPSSGGGGGGGGALGAWWGLGLWAWVLALASRRQRR